MKCFIVFTILVAVASAAVEEKIKFTIDANGLHLIPNEQALVHRLRRAAQGQASFSSSSSSSSSSQQNGGGPIQFQQTSSTFHTGGGGAGNAQGLADRFGADESQPVVGGTYTSVSGHYDPVTHQIVYYQNQNTRV